MYRSVNIFAAIFLTFSGCKETVTLKNSISDTLRLEELNEIIESRINPLLFNYEGKEAGKILDSLERFVDNTSSLTIFSWLIAKAAQQVVENEYDSARFSVAKATEIAKKSNNDSIIMLAKETTGSLFTITKQWDSALQYVHEAHYLAGKHGTIFPEIYYRLYEIYSAIGDRAAVRKYAYEGFKNSSNDPYYKIIFANAIATYYDEIQQTDSAIMFFKSLEEDTLFYSKHLFALKNENLGVLLTRQNKAREGLSYLLKAMPLNKELGTFDPLSMFNLANAYSQLKQYQKSFAYLDTALKEAQIARDFTLMRQIWYLKGRNHADLGQFPLAFSALDSAYGVYRTEMDSSIAKNANELATRYSLKEKEDKISSLALSKMTADNLSRQRKVIIIGLGIVILLLTIIGFLMWRRRQMRTLMREAALRQQLLRSQIDTHFAFNSLTILKGFIRKDLKERSISYLDDFSDLLRLTIENARESFVPLRDEISALEKYMNIQAINFDDRFNHYINANIDRDVLVPPMLLQPFAENAILHGFGTIDYQGKITIEIEKKGEILECVIEDNGVGLHSEGRKEKRSLSTLITQERLAILSRKTRKAGQLAIIDKQTENKGQGVKVMIQIPYR